MVRHLRALVVLLLLPVLVPMQAIGGTTGGIVGRVVDAQSRAALSDVKVTAVSPSQSATVTTDSSGQYRFLSLPPDTYSVQFLRDGYNGLTQPGVTVLADQVQTVNIALVQSLKTIANVTARGTGALLKPGTTSDVYSVNASMAQAAAPLVGPGGLSNAYGAIASVPGVAIDGGEQGWFQTVHIRGGDIDQVGYEMDGIPVNRVYDNAPQTMLTSLGQQELQVYTGGTPASADAQGIAGYVNQVIKTGTSPGFGQGNLTVGSPAFFHRASAEAGGSTPNRLFSYYVGIAGANQDYRYINNSNGGGALNYFYYPVNAFDCNTFAPGPSDVYVLGNTPWSTPYCSGSGFTSPYPLFANGNTFGIANSSQRDSVANFHIGIPHKNGLRDDVQLLYLWSGVFASYYSAANEIAGTAAGPLTGYASQFYWNDGPVYAGAMFKPATASNVATYFFPSSPAHAPLSNFPGTARDTNDNGVGITKVQYQHNFNDRSFLRVYGYTMYSNWFIHGPNSADEIYGAELADYEIPDHTFGGNLNFTDQLSQRHLLSASASYTGSNLQRYSLGFVRSNPNVATLVDPSSNCYDGTTGAQTLCYDPNAQLGAGTLASGAPPIVGSAATNGANYVATSGGLIANLNQVHTRFSSVALTDQWHPNDRFLANIGVRVETFKYLLGDTSPNDPARQFWFTQYNQDHCFGPGDTSPTLGSIGPGGSTICSNAGEQTLAALGPGAEILNESGGSLSTTRWEPRISFTDTINPETVLRGSYGIYARPQNSSWVQYNTVQEDLPSFLGSHFYSYGFRTPLHAIRPDTSNNFDLSLEKRLHGTDWSFKLTPFYRSTQDQLQNFFIDPLTGLESGLNVGHQISYGVEFAVQKGDFNRDGWAGQLSYTYTHSRIQYRNFDNSNVNVIDNLNTFIQQYNSYTKTCAGANPTQGAAGYNPLCGANGGANAATSFSNAGVTINNPYFNASAQPLLDHSGYYSTYDIIPGPFSAENGYETPDVASLILNYRHQRLTVTPTFTYSSGAKYGAPLAWPGYLPDQCTATLAGAPAGTADPASCGSATGLPLFIPDVYTGQFDNLGAFKQPWRFGMNLALGYDVTPRITARVVFANLVDHCGQRGYAWDQPNVCVYGNLPSGIFAPAGNFYPNSNGAAPVQMKYPYTFLLNNNNTGFVGTTIPLQITFDVQFKL
ncbi:MAG: carboxypeptidase regulatory-like domain-containing protein [Vulcanimicrobiaceae bacterium]